MVVSAVAGGLFALGVVAPGPAAAPLPRAAQADGPTVPEPREPRPPLLPADFQGTGRYIVRDLGIDVPFSWQGRDGNSQMTAGGPEHPIWFTNLIYENTLYTLTYRWPNIPLFPPRACSKIPGFFNRQIFNDKLKTARYVGPEILQGDQDRHVDHWRVGRGRRLHCAGGVLPVPDRARRHLRRPARPEPGGGRCCSSACRTSSTRSWTSGSRWTPSSHRPGEVTLPDRCPPPTP